MEKSILIDTHQIHQVRELNLNLYQRIYFGSETCDKLVPSINDIQSILELCRKNKLTFSFLTPPIGEKRFGNLVKTFSYLKDVDFKNIEIVVNDLGVLFFLKQSNYPFSIELGRAIHKQIKDKRAFLFDNKETEKIISSPVNNKYFQNFLNHFSIKRIAFDNIPCLSEGISINNQHEFSGTLFYPYILLSLGRGCLLKKITNPTKSFDNCSKQCSNLSIDISKFKNMPLTTYCNAIYYKNEILPENLTKIGINRIVYQTLK